MYCNYVQPRMEALYIAGWYECDISPCRGWQELPIEPESTPRAWEMRELCPLEEFEFPHAWKCVCQLKIGGKCVVERESPPKRVGGGQLCGQEHPKEAHFFLGPRMGFGPSPLHPSPWFWPLAHLHSLSSPCSHYWSHNYSVSRAFLTRFEAL